MLNSAGTGIKFNSTVYHNIIGKIWGEFVVEDTSTNLNQRVRAVFGGLTSFSIKIWGISHGYCVATTSHISAPTRGL